MLSRLRLAQFRCFSSVDVRCCPGTHLLVGANAQGKTSFLEAVCLVLRLQSPRTSTLRDLVQIGTDGFSIEADTTASTLRILHRPGRKRQLFVDREPVVGSAAYLAASTLVVWMGGTDRELVRGPSSRRRRYLDFVGSQISPGYREDLRRFERALKVRNALLKRGPTESRQIAAWTAVLVEHGIALVKRRGAVCRELGGPLAEAHQLVGGSGESLSIRYEPGCGDDLRAELDARRDDEFRRGITLVGPHRDDLRIAIDDRPADRYASEGQQRTAATAMKLAQIPLLRSRHGSDPVILIDDVFGELDRARRSRLLDALPPKAQIFITTTDVHWLSAAGWRPDLHFAVQAGSLAIRNLGD